MNDTQKLLKEGLSDAIGFVGGALAGYWVARWLGFDIFAEGVPFRRSSSSQWHGAYCVHGSHF